MAVLGTFWIPAFAGMTSMVLKYMSSEEEMPNNEERDSDIGAQMHAWACDLFPVNRSLTGPGVRETLTYLADRLPGLRIHAIDSGTQAFDWTVPDEWTVRDAYVMDESGNKIIDFQTCNLHLVGYSVPVDEWMSLDALQARLHSLPEQPDAIPYVTAYYSRYWGFCVTDRVRQSLPPGRYRAVIDSDLKPGVLNYAELILPGESAREVLLSTYVCHPSMANNELSGPVVTAALTQWLRSLKRRRYTYRIVFVPETIGSIVYLSRHIDAMKRNTIAGFNITCIGDDRGYSYLPSRAGNTLADHAARHVLKHIDPSYRSFRWLDRGSDERQYCAPGVDLPVATIMRSKYGEYPEYHTSLDDLRLVTPSGLQGGYDALRQAIAAIENNCRPKMSVLGEPQLGKRGLYPQLSTKESGRQVQTMMDLISYCDGKRTLLEIADILEKPMSALVPILDTLANNDLVEKLWD